MSIPAILLIGSLIGFVLLSLHRPSYRDDVKRVLSGVKSADKLDCNSWEGRIRPYSEDFVRKSLSEHGYNNIEITHCWLRNSRIVVKL